MAYSGTYKVKNTDKYKGDHTRVVYRSLWERGAFKWLDNNPDVIAWCSEELVIPYICKTDNSPHRYFPDLLIKFKNGKVLLVEIKPEYQTKAPDMNKKNTKKLLTEALTYAKNISKWQAAKEFCKAKGWEFQIWDEHSLNAIGIKTLNYTKRPKKKT